MGLIKEFKEFAVRGNVVDLAIGIVIGGAFQKIVSSLVDNVIMPPIGMLVGQFDFKDYVVVLRPEVLDPEGKVLQAAVSWRYGMFINSVIDFLIVAFTIFLIIRQINRLRKPAEAPVPTTKDCPYCLSAIPIKATRCGHCTSELRA